MLVPSKLAVSVWVGASQVTLKHLSCPSSRLGKVTGPAKEENPVCSGIPSEVTAMWSAAGSLNSGFSQVSISMVREVKIPSYPMEPPLPPVAPGVSVKMRVIPSAPPSSPPKFKTADMEKEEVKSTGVVLYIAPTCEVVGAVRR